MITVATPIWSDADHEEDAAEDQELADLVDVGGDPGDQGAAALGVLGEDRQVVDVTERLDPQRGEAGLGGGEEAAGHEVRRDAGDHDRERGHQSHLEHELDVGTVGAVEPAVEGLLHDDRDDDLADGGEHREREGARRGRRGARARPRRRGGSCRAP